MPAERLSVEKMLMGSSGFRWELPRLGKVLADLTISIGEGGRPWLALAAELDVLCRLLPPWRVTGLDAKSVLGSRTARESNDRRCTWSVACVKTA